MISGGVRLVSVLSFFAAIYGIAEANCGGDLIMEEGSLQNRNYRQPIECTWRITVPKSQQVVLTFETFNFYDCPSCFCYLEIRDGHEKTSPVLGRLCGSKTLPEDILSSYNMITVKLVARDGSFRFKANFTGVPVFCKKDLKRIEFNADQHFRCTNGRCISRSRYCTGHDECGDNSDEEFCSIEFFDTCPNCWYTCGTSVYRCYPSYWHCDGYDDCPGGADEKNCTVSSSNNTTNTMTLKHAQEEMLDQEPPAYVGDDEALKNLTHFYLNMRQSGHLLNRWGHHLPKIAMALYLADPDFFQPTNHTGQEIAYEISLQLLSKLSLKVRLSTHELSLYVNALLVSCIDPRNFFGINVVAELRKRADSSNYTNPFTILTLCNARDDMTMDDVSKVLSAFDMQHRRLWTDDQALATIALACLSTRPNLTVDATDLDRMIVVLKRKQHKNGTVDNLATTALVVQALMATNSYLSDFDIKEAMKFISQTIRNESLSTTDSFYVLPVLSRKSLLNISSDHCKAPVRTDIDVLEDLRSKQDERIQVQYSIFVGDDMDFIRTWKIKVPANYTFYNVLESIASLEPEFRVRYSVIDGKPYVSGLTKMVDHAEKGMYWFIYKQKLGSSEEPKLIESSPVDIQINKDEELILWYRSGSWISK